MTVLRKTCRGAEAPKPAKISRPPAVHHPVDAAEINAFLGSVRPKLRRLLASYRVPVEDSEDLVQDALVALLIRWDRMHDIASREAWLLGTLRNTVFLYWRRRGRDHRLLCALTHTVPPAEPVPPQSQRDLLLDAAAVTASLDDRDLYLLWLFYALELSPPEAAVHLGCQESSVRKLARRALVRAQRTLVSCG